MCGRLTWTEFASGTSVWCPYCRLKVLLGDEDLVDRSEESRDRVSQAGIHSRGRRLKIAH